MIWHAFDIVAKAGAVLILFLLAAFAFGLLLNITFANLVQETREIGLAGAREDIAAAEEKEGCGNQGFARGGLLKHPLDWYLSGERSEEDHIPCDVPDECIVYRVDPDELARAKAFAAKALEESQLKEKSE